MKRQLEFVIEENRRSREILKSQDTSLADLEKSKCKKWPLSARITVWVVSAVLFLLAAFLLLQGFYVFENFVNGLNDDRYEPEIMLDAYGNRIQ